MVQIALVDPLAVVNGRKAMFLRDSFGGEVPLSCPYPPLELAFSAALLRENGIGVNLIAANVLGIHHAELAERLANDPPEFVLIPSAWGSLPDDYRLIQILKDALPNTQLVLSGPNVTAEPEKSLTRSVVDFIIMGEPEESILRLGQGEDRHSIPNLAFMENGEMVITDRRLPPDWENYPMPARDLLELDLYTVPFSRRLPATTIATTRGCGHSCVFCPTQIWHHRQVRERPVPLVMEEIDELVGRYGIRELNIRDDTFTWNRDRVFEICEALLKRGHDLTWRCFATASTVDEDLLSMMSAAGCTQVCYGFESGDEQVLRTTGKGTTVEQGRQAIQWSRAAGLEISGTFIVGLEGENMETINRSIAFAKDNSLDYIQVNVAVPMPATAFGKRRKRQGLESNPEDFRWYGAKTSETKALSSDDLTKQARRFYREFYLRPTYIGGRLTSRRGLSSLLSHARLGWRMARYLAEPLLPWA
jgi:radical SAM superfamily enzyme YgiQ (UPF0313 family)